MKYVINLLVERKEQLEQAASDFLEKKGSLENIVYLQNRKMCLDLQKAIKILNEEI